MIGWEGDTFRLCSGTDMPHGISMPLKRTALKLDREESLAVRDQSTPVCSVYHFPLNVQVKSSTVPLRAAMPLSVHATVPTRSTAQKAPLSTS